MSVHLKRYAVGCALFLALSVACDGDEPTPCPECPTSPTPPGVEGSIIIQDMTNVAWTTTNNRFAGGDAHIPGDPNDRLIRFPRLGVLMQIGEYEDPTAAGPPSHCQGVRLEGPTVDETYALTAGFYWFDIESNFTPADPGGADSSTPMEDDDIFMLYPNKKLWVGGTAARIHPRLEPRALITYWEGEHGYDLHARLTNDPDHYRNSLTFDLLDPVTVRVHQIAASPPFGELAVSSIAEFTNVTTITVLAGTTPTSHGNMLDPPWP